MPFTIEQFIKVFESYNHAIYPIQWVLDLLAIVAVFLAVKTGLYSGRVIAALLAILWLWMGIAYHLVFFTGINKAAYFFALLCIVQAAIFLLIGVARNKLNFRAKFNTVGIIGWVLIIFALFIYPALGYLFGHMYPQSPTFGTPCPTTIFTFGLLLWVERKMPLYVLAIPFLWSLIGFTAALTLGIREDTGLLVAGMLGTLLMIWKNKSLKENTPNPSLKPSAQ